MKKRLIILILCICVLSGCIRDNNDINPDEQNNDNKIYFNFYYSSSSSIEDTVNIIITTDKIEILNESISLIKGKKIFQEEASGNMYYIRIQWENHTTTKEYLPDGYNTLFLIINESGISFKVVNVD